MRTSRNPTFGSSATEFGRSYTCTTLLPPRKSDSRHQSGDFWMSKSYDRYLGLDRSITRRDFMNGAAMVIGASMLPGSHAFGATDSSEPQNKKGYDPPVNTGLRRSEERRVGKECRSRWS